MRARSCPLIRRGSMSALVRQVTPTNRKASSEIRYSAFSKVSYRYTKAFPTSAEGGLAFGDTLSIACKNPLDNCIRHAGRSGTPDNRHMALAECRNQPCSNVQSSKLNTRERRMFKRPTAYVLKATRPCAVAYGYARIRRLVRLYPAR